MKKREIERIEKAVKELKKWAEEIDDVIAKENLLNRANALEWVLSIAEPSPT